METNEEYHADKTRLSNSMLNDLRQSPKLFYELHVAKTAPPKEQTDSMRLGDVVHCLVLEPDEAHKRFAVRPDGIDRRTKEGKSAWVEFVDSTPRDATIIDSEEWRTAKLCANSLLSHGVIGELFDRNNLVIIEKRIDFEWLCVPCRCKPDALFIEDAIIVDIKTTQNASPKAFAKSLATYGYARQNAFYREAARQFYNKNFLFLNAVVSTQFPYESAVYELEPDEVKKAENELDELVTQYIQRKEQNDWDASWSRGIVPLRLPKYYDAEIYQLEQAE